MIFGEYFFKKKVRKMIELSNSRKHRYCSLDEAENILVLFRDEDRDQIEEQLKKIRSLKKQVRYCVACDNIMDKPADPSVYYIYKNKDTDKYGIPNQEVTNNILKIPADILFDLSRGKSHTLKAIMLQHPSMFKIGEKLGEEAYYDFSIIMTEGGGIKELFENLLFYLQTIRSK